MNRRSTGLRHGNANEKEQDTRQVRGDHPFIFTNLKNERGLSQVVDWLESQYAQPTPRWYEPIAHHHHVLAHQHAG